VPPDTRFFLLLLRFASPLTRWRTLQFYYCDHLFFSGEALDVVSAAQHAYFQALVGRHQELQATYLNIWRRVVCKLSQQNVEESYTFWYRFIYFYLLYFKESSYLIL